MKVIITKYALTSGVVVADATLCAGSSGSMVKVQTVNFGAVYYHKPSWHTDKAEANAQVVRMVEAKKKALTRALAKLDGKVVKADVAISAAEL